MGFEVSFLTDFCQQGINNASLEEVMSVISIVLSIIYVARSATNIQQYLWNCIPKFRLLTIHLEKQDLIEVGPKIKVQMHFNPAFVADFRPPIWCVSDDFNFL